MANEIPVNASTIYLKKLTEKQIRDYFLRAVDYAEQHGMTNRSIAERMLLSPRQFKEVLKIGEQLTKVKWKRACIGDWRALGRKYTKY